MNACSKEPAPTGRVRRLLIGLLSLVALSGCSHLVTRATAYYEDGPGQLEQPQGELSEGTHVLVIGKEGSYSRVWTLGGIDAYVWSNSLKSAWEWPKFGKSEDEGLSESGAEQ